MIRRSFFFSLIYLIMFQSLSDLILNNQRVAVWETINVSGYSILKSHSRHFDVRFGRFRYIWNNAYRIFFPGPITHFYYMATTVHALWLAVFLQWSGLTS